MTLANIALTNTFFDQMTRLNQVTVLFNSLNEGYFEKVAGTIQIDNSTFANSNVSLNVANGYIKGNGYGIFGLPNTSIVGGLKNSQLQNSTITIVSNAAGIIVTGGLANLGNTAFLNISYASSVTDSSTSNIVPASLLTAVYNIEQSDNVYLRSAVATAQATASAAATPGSVGSAFTQANVALTTAQGAFLTANTINVTVSNTQIGIGRIATRSEYSAGTSRNLLVGVADAWDSALEIILTDSALINVDFSLGYNYKVTIAGNRTLNRPTNFKKGQSGYIRIVQDGIGSRTLAYNTAWQFAGAVAPALTTSANRVDTLYYQVTDSSNVYASLAKDVR